MFTLEVSQLRYAYGERVAVDALSFEIRPSTIFGLLGPNGAGKTTTISCIGGLLANFRGSMKFEGQDFRPAARIEDRRKIGVVPQELALYDNLSALENLKLFGSLYGLRGKQLDLAIAKQLEISGLAERQHDFVSAFSGGMKRRLNLAIGLIHEPRLVLLDEPTVGVDPQSRTHLFEAFEKLKDDGLTLLYTTHYMEEAERLCDEIAIMNEGGIASIGTAEQLRTQVGDVEASLETVFLQLTGRNLRD